MRHGVKTSKLQRNASHRRALLANQACSLILNGRITTTLANIHAHDTVALDTDREHICTLADLHVKLGQRLTDSALVAMIEIIDLPRETAEKEEAPATTEATA